MLDTISFYRMTGAKLVPYGIVGRNLETKQKVLFQVPSHNAIVDEVGTSLLLSLGKTNLTDTGPVCL